MIAACIPRAGIVGMELKLTVNFSTIKVKTIKFTYSYNRVTLNTFVQ